jgi:type II secretory pathway pseudopilin PulG
VKRILPILIVGMLGAWTVAAQSSASVQTSTSTQSQGSVQADKSGAQASGSGSSSTSASANAGKSSVDISGGTKIDATLANSLDAKKSKPGDPVEARTTQDVKQDGKVVLKKGTRLVGHVTQAQARAKDQAQSQLGVVFDHAVLSTGQEVPFHATIQALAAAQSTTAATAGSDDIMASGSGMGSASGTTRSGGGLVGGVASTTGATAGSVVNTASSASGNAGGTLNAATHSAGAVGGLTSTGRLASSSSGVFGLQGLSIDSAASSATQGSMIVSSTKNVHLDSGTQMLLTVTGQAK